MNNLINIENKILVIRGQQVMLDRDLAEIYGYTTKAFNQQVKNNIEKFPDDMMFQLSKEELEYCSRSNFLTLNRGRGFNIKYLPFVFTEQGIFLQGQIFDAYIAFQDLIQKAHKEIILIDNYIDLTVLERLTKKNLGVNVTIYTQPNTPITQLDISKFNTQYPTLTIKFTTKMHDRFLILDKNEIYFIGVSIKDLGKKCFGFIQLEDAQWMIKTVLLSL